MRRNNRSTKITSFDALARDFGADRALASCNCNATHATYREVAECVFPDRPIAGPHWGCFAVKSACNRGEVHLFGLAADARDFSNAQARDCAIRCDVMFLAVLPCWGQTGARRAACAEAMAGAAS